MRIEAYTQVQQVYKASRAEKSQKTEKTAFSDKLQLSTMGKDYQTAKQAVANSPDVREEVTAPLRQSIQSGAYEVSAEKFADKLLQKFEMR